MSDDKLTATSKIDRTPVHPSITPQQISQLVDQFYARVQQDVRLGPIFSHQVDGDWEPHLEKMKSFWRSVLLKTSEYKGRPVPAHVGISGVTTDDFRTWLQLFKYTAGEVLDPGAAPIAIAAAERIASSLWLAMNISDNPFAAPPVWSSQSN